MLGSYVDLGNPVADHPLNRRDRLVAWYVGLQGVGSVGPVWYDVLGSWPGTWSGTPVRSSAPSGPAPYLSGGAYIDLGNLTAIEGLTNFTVAIGHYWYSSVGTGSFPGLFSKSTNGAELDLIHWSGTQIFGRIGQTAGYGIGGTIKFDAWQHTVMAFDGSQVTSADRLKIYQDGVNQTLTFGGLPTTTTPTNGAAATVGRYGINGSTANAVFGEVRLYRATLSQTEVVEAATQFHLGCPDTLRRWSRRYYLLNTSGSSPVTVALTGQSATSAQGMLTPSAAVTLTGSAGTGGTGTLSPTLSPALTGQSVTAYGPTSIPCPQGQARQYDVGPFTGGTGDYATLTGTVRVSRDTAYDEDGADTGFWRVGYSGTVGPWTVVLQYATPVDGSTRFLAVFCSSAAPADMSYGQDTGVTSCCGTYTTFSEGGSGTGTQPDPPDVAPVGLCDGCGDLFPTAAVAQTGQAVTSAAGTVTYSASTALTGLSSTTDTGTLTPETGYVLSLTGQEITASTGSPTPAVATSLTGDNATGAAGTMVVGVAYTLVGNGVTTAAGAVTVTIAATLTGDAVATAAGTLTADMSAALTGNSTTTTTGTLTPELAAAIVGLSTTPAQGTIDPQTGWLIPLTGQSVTISQGTLGVSITVGITGQSAAVSQGSLTASVYVPFGELYGKWAYPQPKTGRWQYTSPKAGKWTYPDELAGRWTPSV